MRRRKRRYSSKRLKRKLYIIIVFFLLLSIGLGYAYLQSVLSIGGTTIVSKNSWDVHFENLKSTDNTKVSIVNGTTVRLNVTLSPGENFTYIVDAVNNGTIDAKIGSITAITVPEAYQDVIEYSLNYNFPGDGEVISVNDVLRSETSEAIKFTIKYKDEDELDSDVEGVALNLNFSVNYVQADSNITEVVHRNPSFATDSWSTIVENVSIGNGQVYAPKKGEEVLREVTLTGFSGTHYLRVANTTDCTNGETSETACGFVVEFADIITTHRMNPYDSSSTALGNGNIGGWKNSEMRNYVNNDIYNALPDEIKNSIKKTKVISSHGNASEDSTNLESEDYLYLLSTKEVWNGGTGFDTADNTTPPTTRQLDYYSVNGVTTSNYSGAIKKQDNNTNAAVWWLRTAYSNSSGSFLCVHSPGRQDIYGSIYTHGVSPAFRIGD